MPRTRVDLIPSRPFTSAISETLLGTHAMMRCIDEALLTHDFRDSWIYQLLSKSSRPQSLRGRCSMGC